MNRLDQDTEVVTQLLQKGHFYSRRGAAENLEIVIGQLSDLA
jgi:hypothetical protein